MGLFKSKEERASIKFDKGSDLIARREFDSALRNFNKIISLGQAGPEVYVLKQMLEMRDCYSRPDVLSYAADVFSRYPGLTVKYGVYDVNVDAMLYECRLRLKAQQVLSDKMICNENGMALIRTASELAAYDRTFILDEIFAERKITSRDYSNMMYALGYEMLSEAIKWEDPRKAAEYQQQALIYNSERHNENAASANREFIRAASITARCWFCGKEVSGENIHFVPMASDLTLPIIRQADPDRPMPTNTDSCVYACRACFSAFDNLGMAYLRTGERYTDSRIEELRAELEAEIDSLRAAVLHS